MTELQHRPASSGDTSREALRVQFAALRRIDPAQRLALMTLAEDELGEQAYHVGGSVASSAHGMYRASADVDVVIDPGPGQLDALAAALDPEFYVSRSAMAEALSQRGTFNAIHVPTSFKIDFFIKGRDPFDSEELRRSLRQVIGADPTRTVFIKSPEGRPRVPTGSGTVSWPVATRVASAPFVLLRRAPMV